MLPAIRSSGDIGRTLTAQRGLTAQSLLSGPTPGLSLVCPAGSAAVCHLFDAGLRAGRGIRLCIDLPCLVNHPGVRRLPRTDFSSIDVFALWRG